MILPTNMSRRINIILKSRYDETVIKLLAEKLKEMIFPRKGFHKPKVSDVELISVEKEYEQYLIIKGKYSIDHCKSLIYNLEVEKGAQKVFLLNETLEPKACNSANPDNYSTIQLKGVASFHYEDEARCVIDNRGQEIDAKEVDSVLNEQWQRELLNKSGLRKKIAKFRISAEEEINLLKAKLVNRPQDVGEVIKEIFEINERKIFHIPIYKLNFRNKKTKKEALIKINGITGKIILTTFSNKILPIKIDDLDIKSHKLIKPFKASSVEESRKFSNGNINVTNESLTVKESRKSRSNIKNNDNSKSKKVVLSPLSISKEAEEKINKENLEFPAKVAGDVFYVGNSVTAIVGDIEIPPRTIVNDTLVVKGNLRIGKRCRILATVKAMGNIVIDADSIIKGNVISHQNVSIGPRVKIDGEVIVKKTLQSQSLDPQGNIDD